MTWRLKVLSDFNEIFALKYFKKWIKCRNQEHNLIRRSNLKGVYEIALSTEASKACIEGMWS